MKILEMARDAAQYAYAPYSNYKVGCAIELKDETYVLGCNVENISYGLSICAERTAIFNTVSRGIDRKNIKALAIYNDKENLSSPCGACRQVLLELVDKNVKIYLCNKNLEYKEVAVADLLPFAFDSLE